MLDEHGLDSDVAGRSRERVAARLPSIPVPLRPAAGLACRTAFSVCPINPPSGPDRRTEETSRPPGHSVMRGTTTDPSFTDQNTYGEAPVDPGSGKPPRGWEERHPRAGLLRHSAGAGASLGVVEEHSGVMSESATILSTAPWPPGWARWVRACTLAEVLGMAAASSAAVISQAVVGSATGAGPAVVGLVLAVLGGLAEGLFVGLLQFRVLRGWLPLLSRRRYVGGTVILAGGFWLLGMLPSTLMTFTGPASPGAEPIDPPLLAVLVVAGAGGAFGGVAFGVVQGWALRGHVPHPWRWIRPNAVGWAIAVAVITIGAVAVPGSWPVGVIIVYGVGVGLLAGASVGLVTAQALPSLELDLPWWNRVVVDLLLSPAHVLLSRGVVLLRYRGPRTGRTITLPVQYAEAGDDLIVYVARAETKTWWRSFSWPQPARMALRGQRLIARARVLDPANTAHAAALAAYREHQPRVHVPDDAVLVEVSPAVRS